MNKTIRSAIKKEIADRGITRIEVEGFKSLYDRSSIEIRPLTILAGANSSGKSSIMQPLLMMKQTLEAPYDAGVLLLDGPNVKFTSVDQFLSKRSGQPSRDNFIVKLGTDETLFLESAFQKYDYLINLISSTFFFDELKVSLKPDMTREEILLFLEMYSQQIEKYLNRTSSFKFYQQKEDINSNLIFKLINNRCFLNLDCQVNREYNYRLGDSIKKSMFQIILYDNHNINQLFQKEIRQVIHIPGVRGNPERTYKITAIGSGFPGNFETYVASIIQSWQDTQNERLIQLCQNLENLGLTGKVATKIINGVQMEIQVGNLPRNGESVDMVNIADVGFGVSQTLPVLVALLVASSRTISLFRTSRNSLTPSCPRRFSASVSRCRQSWGSGSLRNS
jgi:AAA15 family ATPase/GTPase